MKRIAIALAIASLVGCGASQAAPQAPAGQTQTTGAELVAPQAPPSEPSDVQRTPPVSLDEPTPLNRHRSTMDREMDQKPVTNTTSTGNHP